MYLAQFLREDNSRRVKLTCGDLRTPGLITLGISVPTEEPRVVIGLPPLIPVDPAGLDRYRGRAKPWESYALGKRAWRTAE
jgi:hypothetical protein